MEVDHLYQSIGQHQNYYRRKWEVPYENGMHEEIEQIVPEEEEIKEEAEEDFPAEEDKYDKEDPDKMYQISNMALNLVMTPEQKRRFTSGLCIQCGKKGHYTHQCPHRRPQQNRRPSNFQ